MQEHHSYTLTAVNADGSGAAAQFHRCALTNSKCAFVLLLYLSLVF